MNIDNAPMVGTPKQNAFVCRLAAALGYASLAEAINQALGRPLASALPQPFPVGDASIVIAMLLAEAKTRGINLRRGGKGKGKRTSTKGAQTASQTQREGDKAPAAALAGAPTATLVEVLESRGVPAQLAASNPDLVGSAEVLLQAALQCVISAESAEAPIPFALREAVAALRAAIESTGTIVPPATLFTLCTAA